MKFSELSINALDGSSDLLAQCDGDVVLVVNVASQCGLTPQYEGLQLVYEELRDQGFMVVGFPCNQFGGQEPGSPEEITSFCQSNYGVSFPMSEKIDVNGPGRHPVYSWLTSEENGFPGDIQWNFEKFLIGRDGEVLGRYGPRTSPEDVGLLQDLADALG